MNASSSQAPGWTGSRRAKRASVAPLGPTRVARTKGTNGDLPVSVLSRDCSERLPTDRASQPNRVGHDGIVPGGMHNPMRPAARFCWALHARQQALTVLDVSGALLFVLGCLAFYNPSNYTVGVTLFLVGSVLMLASTTGRAFVQYGPSE